MSDVDLFADVTDTSATLAGDEVATGTETEDSTTGTETDNSGENGTSTPEPTVSTIPDGAVSVTQFSELLTYTRNDDGSPKYGFILPQAVYQAVKAKNNPLPHVLVQEEGETSPRVYVLRDEAIAAWGNRPVRVAGGATSGSSRDADTLKADFAKADTGPADRLLYAQERADYWTGKAADFQKTWDKYLGWMKEKGVGVDEINDIVAAAKSDYNARAQAKITAKEDVKAANKAKKEAAKAQTEPVNA